MRVLNLTQQKKKIFCHRTVSSSCGVHGLGTRLGLVWLSHQPRALHHQHTDERVWCPSIQLFVAFPRNVKIKTHGYNYNQMRNAPLAGMVSELFHESVLAMGMELELFRSQFTPSLAGPHPQIPAEGLGTWLYCHCRSVLDSVHKFYVNRAQGQCPLSFSSMGAFSCGSYTYVRGVPPF